MRYKAQVLPSYALEYAFKAQQSSSNMTVRLVAATDVPQTENLISSHVMDKILVNEDLNLKLKALISPHGNEDSLKLDLNSDCAMCFPIGIRTFLSNASLKGWRLSKHDVKTAFLQSGPEQRDL